MDLKYIKKVQSRRNKINRLPIEIQYDVENDMYIAFCILEHDGIYRILQADGLTRLKAVNNLEEIMDEKLDINLRAKK